MCRGKIHYNSSVVKFLFIQPKFSRVIKKVLPTYGTTAVALNRRIDTIHKTNSIKKTIYIKLLRPARTSKTIFISNKQRQQIILK